MFAHGGRTNTQGCHNQRGGEYHCHGKKARKSVSNNYRVAASFEGYDCSKKYCKHMTSCNEAYYKYSQCGHTRLDVDKDGVPCENLCGR